MTGTVTSMVLKYMQISLAIIVHNCNQSSTVKHYLDTDFQDQLKVTKDWRQDGSIVL